MLQLSRKKNQTIHIGKDIIVQVAKIVGRRVYLRIQAPKSVKIVRGELLDDPKETDSGEDVSIC